MKKIIFIFFTILSFVNIQLNASIINTKHNLSISNSVVPKAGETIIKAQVEEEVCVFCHIPHQSRPVGTPLWNRNMPASNYTMYDSDYLRRMGYPDVATDLGVDNNTPGALSRQCLSCHDGTVAVGAVFKLRRNFMDGTSIAMDGVDGAGMMQSTSAGFLGTNLTVHHPVGIEYDPTPILTFGNGETRVMELKITPDSPIKLFEYAAYPGKKYVECSSCHNPHKEGNNTESNKFLHYDSGANLAQNFYGTCTSCHEKTDWIGSVHQSPPDPDLKLYTDPEVIANYGTAKMADLGCGNCHVPHNAGGTPYINRQTMGNTCFQGAASVNNMAPCHGEGGAKNMEAVLPPTKLYGHPVKASSTGDSNHTNLDTLYGYGVGDAEMTDSRGVGGMSWGTNKHAVCMDCHNPHRARAGTHILDGSWYGPIPTTIAEAQAGNLVSNVLKGVNGIEPTWPDPWTQPTTFTTMGIAEKEYQICMKCHSYWGLGPSPDGTTDYISPSGATMTDLAWDMNINNRSGHPVVINQKQRAGSYDTSATDGSTGLRSLQPDQLLSPWKEFPGDNTMYCSDCHGNDTEIGGDPKGPHGSDLKYLLKGANQQWPHKADNITLYNTDDIRNGTDTDLFCKNCHDVGKPHKDWWNTMANKNYACINCHVAVPHGSSVSRLIGYFNFPEPYNYNGNSLKMQGYRKNLQVNDSSDVWASGSQSGDTTCDSTKCHRTDDSLNGAYDTNVFPIP